MKHSDAPPGLTLQVKTPSTSRWMAGRLSPRTASKTRSIWHDVNEDDFRKHLVELSARTNGVPDAPQTYNSCHWQAAHTMADFTSHVLPFEIERRIAEDFAYLVAVKQGGQSVSAVTVEERVDHSGMILCLAALDSFAPALMYALQEVCDILKSNAVEIQTPVEVMKIPEVDAGRSSVEERLFGTIMSLHHERLIARLRSRKWQKPKYLAASHKKPLWKDFANLLHRTSIVYARREVKQRQQLEVSLQHLASTYEAFEDTQDKHQAESTHLRALIKQSYLFGISDQATDLITRLNASGQTSQVAAAVKTFHQIEKIGAYWAIARSLSLLSQRYQNIFYNIQLSFLPSYANVSTNVAFEKWAKVCHVHAEVQIIVHHDLKQTNDTILPRVIGASKYACYLCAAFIRYHGKYFISASHGKLYDQWTIPDLVGFDDHMAERYRGLCRAIDMQVRLAISDNSGPRIQPMTSQQDLRAANEALKEAMSAPTTQYRNGSSE